MPKVVSEWWGSVRRKGEKGEGSSRFACRSIGMAFCLFAYHSVGEWAL